MHNTNYLKKTNPNLNKATVKTETQLSGGLFSKTPHGKLLDAVLYNDGSTGALTFILPVIHQVDWSSSM